MGLNIRGYSVMQEIHWLDEIFLSTDLWGWFGPVILIVVSFIILSNKKTKPLGIIFLVIQILVLSIYLDLVEATAWYWWNIIIMVLGFLICIVQAIR